MKITAKYLNGSFTPNPEETAKFKNGQDYELEVKQPRNIGHHRKFYALMNLVFQNQDKYETLEDLIVEVKLRCGHYQEHISVKGNIMYMPKSIDFARMPQPDFEEFYSKAIDVVLKYFWDSSRDDLDSLVKSILTFS